MPGQDLHWLSLVVANYSTGSLKQDAKQLTTALEEELKELSS